jgi:hypothetical protein
MYRSGLIGLGFGVGRGYMGAGIGYPYGVYSGIGYPGYGYGYPGYGYGYGYPGYGYGYYGISGGLL